MKPHEFGKLDFMSYRGSGAMPTKMRGIRFDRDLCPHIRRAWTLRRASERQHEVQYRTIDLRCSRIWPHPGKHRNGTVFWS